MLPHTSAKKPVKLAMEPARPSPSSSLSIADEALPLSAPSSENSVTLSASASPACASPPPPSSSSSSELDPMHPVPSHRGHFSSFPGSFTVHAHAHATSLPSSPHHASHFEHMLTFSSSSSPHATCYLSLSPEIHVMDADMAPPAPSSSSGMQMHASASFCSSSAILNCYDEAATFEAELSPPRTPSPYTQWNYLADSPLPLPQHLGSLTFDEELSRRTFVCSFINNLLPALRKIHSPSFSDSNNKLSAVKFASDTSLAVTAGRTKAWSQALLRKVGSCTKVRDGGRKPYRKMRSRMHVSNRSISALCRRARGRSNMQYRVLVKGMRFGGSERSPIMAYSPKDECMPVKELHTKLQNSKLKRPLHSRGLASYRRILRSTRCKRKQNSMKVASVTNDASDITKEQFDSLGRLVPGGDDMDAPRLLEEAADYILALQMQVEALQSISRIVSA